ncbi:chemotaxis protein CheY [Clostridiales bacterium PH28_bin88]|nr:chemotaxis protein CheY [Clostridiales bacterium PH28_bin88]
MRRLRPIRVLIVDDSALMRKFIAEIFAQDPEIEVVGSARDGQEAVRLAGELEPDVITMDINMPRMDGLTALQHIMYTRPVPVIVLSSLAKKGELATFEALELGAVDCIEKPGGTVSVGIAKIAQEIRMKVKGAASANTRAAARTLKHTERPMKSQAPSRGLARKLIVIGVSTGGPKTLVEILPALPDDLPAGVLVVQHMPGSFTRSFADRLNSICQMRVAEAGDGQAIEPGQILVAPGDYHLRVERRLGTDSLRVRLSTEPSSTLYRPSVTVTMESALKAAGGSKLVAVLLTGMGDDGAQAMVKIRQAGGRTIAESEETAVVWGMPREAIVRGGAEIVAASYQIAGEITRAVKG